MAKAIHSMIRVVNEQKSLDFYSKAFDLNLYERIDFDTFSLLYLRGEGTTFELELTVNKDQKEPYDLGNGYGHLAVCVENLEAEHKKMADLGYEPRDIVDFQHQGKPLAKFFFIKDPDGYDIEVLQRAGRFQ